VTAQSTALLSPRAGADACSNLANFGATSEPDTGSVPPPVRERIRVSVRVGSAHLLFASLVHAQAVAPAGVVIADLPALLLRESKARVDDRPPDAICVLATIVGAGVETGRATAMLRDGSTTGRRRIL